MIEILLVVPEEWDRGNNGLQRGMRKLNTYWQWMYFNYPPKIVEKCVVSVIYGSVLSGLTRRMKNTEGKQRWNRAGKKPWRNIVNFVALGQK